MFRTRTAGHVLRVSFVVVALLSGIAGRVNAQMPSPWTARDIGSPALAGTSSYDQPTDTFTIDAGGTDIWGTSDQFRFIYQQISGDVEIIARVDAVTNADAWSKTGVMIRKSLSANSAHGLAVVSAAKGIAFQRRGADGGSSTSTSGGTSGPPRWVRIVRSGSTLTAYVSSTGTTWTTIGSDTISLGTSAYVGIATTSHNASVMTNADVAKVSIKQQGLPSPLVNADIGAPALKGSTSYNQGTGTFTITAGGTDIWDPNDQFQYVYQPVTGDVDISLHLSSLVNTHAYAKAGVMIREALTGTARHASADLAASAGYSFERRATSGGASTYTSGGAGVPPGWVRLKRVGTLFTAYKSTDGTNWTVMGSDNISMANAVYVGIAVTGHSTSAMTTAVVDKLSITQSQTSNQPPTVSLTAPASGSTFSAPGTITLSATASDPEGQLSKVEFYQGSTLIGTDTSSPYSYTWSSVAAGSYTLTAVAYDAAGNKTTSNASSVTVGTVNKPPTVSLTAPSTGATFTAPASITITASAADPEGLLSKVEFYAGTTLLNTDTASPFTFTWSSVAAGSYSLTAVAYDTAGAKTTSAAVAITVGSTLTLPRAVVFQKSPDHTTLVTSYRLDVFVSTANPNTATPIATVNLGKPTPDANGDITSVQQTLFTALAAGNYLATVTAIGSGGSTRSASITFTR